MDIREKSYESLRNELIQWQSRRYVIFSSTLVFVTAIIGWIVTSEKEWNFYTASILPLLIIIGASLLTRNTTVYSTKIGTYFQVFYNDEWEVAQEKFSQKAKTIPTNKYFAIFFLFTSILSNMILYYETKLEQTTLLIIVFSLVWILTIIAIYYVGFKSYPREIYIKYWEEIKKPAANN